MYINEVEPKLAQELDRPLRDILHELSYFIPGDYKPRVSLLDANGRKKKSNAAANNWTPQAGRIEIRFEPVVQANEHATQKEGKGAPTRAQTPATPFRTYVHPAEGELLRALDKAEVELLRALDRAESRPGWNFVPLKKFRDEILPSEPLRFMRTDVEQRTILNSAIEKRLVLTSKVQNPKAPQFPVTTIRLNRLMPEVKAALGQPGKADLEFKPVEIAGEPLSTTILRERR
jgi:hypothetical protein